MKERPILFSGAMVRAILAGTKTQTRRVINPQPEYVQADGRLLKLEEINAALWPTAIARLIPSCPHGAPGDSLWVRESLHCAHATNEALYTADNADVMRDGVEARWEWQRATLPSIHMPRWACRLELKIAAVRVERVQDISDADARAEGVAKSEGVYRDHFSFLWDSINAKRGVGWDVNPWVWVIEFTKVEA